jgi:hypothetical protein
MADLPLPLVSAPQGIRGPPTPRHDANVHRCWEEWRGGGSVSNTETFFADPPRDGRLRDMSRIQQSSPRPMTEGSH